MGPDPHPVDEPTPKVEYKVRVLHGLHDHTAQTAGMLRRSAVDKESTGSERLWFGRVTCPAGLNSGPHHHAEAETAGHMLSGDRIRVYFGNNYEEYIEVKPGDYLFVPAYVPHIEVNMSDTEEAEFIAARTPGNIVVPLDGEEPTHLRRD
jgi:uncharacterized RmlC-like cupin family protein